jgi:hypothetical protein
MMTPGATLANEKLTQAKRAKKDEFYTQYADIEREMNAYLEFNPDVFRDKTILLPCDDPEWSNFTRYFAANFDRFGIRKLISTSYAPSSRPDLVTMASAQENAAPIQVVEGRGKLFLLDRDRNQDGRIDIDDLEWSNLEGDGDFRSAEVTRVRDEADIIITNPPFSLFREYIAWIMEGGKLFVAIGNKNAITYKELFPFIKDNRIWSGREEWSGGMWFITTDPEEADRIDDGVPMRNVPAIWLTNVDHGRRHQPLSLMTMADNLRYNKKMGGREAYDRYDNYDAIEVSFTDAIPRDYDGVMGVPITFLDKYCPEQFEIVGSFNAGSHGAEIGALSTDTLINGVLKKWNGPVVNQTPLYKRILIKAIR